MTDIKVKTGKEDSAKTVVVNYEFPTSVAGYVDRFGEEQTASLLGRSVTLAIQALVRQKAAAGTDDSALQNAVNSWQPGVRGPITKKTPYERAQSALTGLSQEELQELLKQYRGKK